MHAPGLSQSSPNRAFIGRPWCLQSLLICWGGTVKSRMKLITSITCLRVTIQSKGTRVQKDSTKVSCSYFACTQTGCKLKGEPLKELKSGTGMLFRHLKRCNEALWQQLMLASKHRKAVLGEDREEVQVSHTPILKLKPQSQSYSDRVCVLCSLSSCLSRNVCRGDRGREWRGECRE
jgi:hypothetical protein